MSSSPNPQASLPPGTPLASSAAGWLLEAPPGAATAGGLTRWQRWTRTLAAPGSRRGALTLADQAVVSATSLLMTILIGRFCGAEALGTYAIAYTVVILSAVIHESLVSSPYMVLGIRHTGQRRSEFAAASLRLHAGLTLAFAAVLMLGGALMPNAADGVWRTMAWVLSLVVPAVMLREFGRRLALAHLRSGLALTWDAALMLLLIALAAGLIGCGRLSVATGLLVLGAASLAAGGASLLVQRHYFARRTPHAAEDLRCSFRFGGPVLAARAVAVVNAYILHWLLAYQLGAQQTGIFAACLTLVNIANPVVLGLGSLLGPQAAHAYAEQHVAGLRQVLRMGLAVTAGLMLVICSALVLGGDALMQLLYGGDAYAGQVATLSTLALHALVGALSMCLFQGLLTLGRSEVSVGVNLLSLVITLAVAGPLIAAFSLFGAALALLAGNLVSTTVQAVLLLQLLRSQA